MVPRTDLLPGVTGVSARALRRRAGALPPDVGVPGGLGLHVSGGAAGARPGGTGPSRTRLRGGLALVVGPRVRVRYSVVPPPARRMAVARGRDVVHRSAARSSARPRDRRDRLVRQGNGAPSGR